MDLIEIGEIHPSEDSSPLISEQREREGGTSWGSTVYNKPERAELTTSCRYTSLTTNHRSPNGASFCCFSILCGASKTHLISLLSYREYLNKLDLSSVVSVRNLGNKLALGSPCFLMLMRRLFLVLFPCVKCSEFPPIWLLLL